MRLLLRVSVLIAGLLLGAGGFAAAAAEHAFVGTKTCKRCHLKQWKSWSETKMAQTFETLKPGVAEEAKRNAGLDPAIDYTKVEGCVVCHVTGLGRPGGFVDIESTPDLAGVGCESCHGAGGTYTQDEYMSLKNKMYRKSEVVAVGLVDQVGPEQCVVCHNPASPFIDTDEEFSFDKSRDRDTHEHFALKYEH